MTRGAGDSHMILPYQSIESTAAITANSAAAAAKRAVISVCSLFEDELRVQDS